MISKAIFSALFFLWIGNVYGQKDYFILIQAENNQPFYARMNNKTFSSSEVGHLIIPQLKDGEYNITIGFPKDIYPEQKFKIVVAKKELGLQLKKTGDKSWALYNWQTKESYTSQIDDTVINKEAVVETLKPTAADPQKIENKPVETPSEETVKTEDKFSRMMAGVVNDSAFLYNTYVDRIPKKDTFKTEVAKNIPAKIDSQTTTVAQLKPVADSPGKSQVIAKANPKKKMLPPVKSTKQPQGITDSSTVAANEQKKNADDSLQKQVAAVKKDVQKKTLPEKVMQQAFVQKLSEQNSDSLFRQVYVTFDKNGKSDTVNVDISKDILVKEMKPVIDTMNKLVKETVPDIQSQKGEVKQELKDTTSKIVSVKEENKAVQIAATPVAVDSINKDSSVTKKPVSSSKPLLNTNCKISATDYDVDKLRVKMLSEDNEDDKIASAKKYFKIKCFTTKQIRALSEVFPNDEGRYKLLDTAYPFVSDASNFPQLADLLTAPYYINRFKAMLVQ
ncbi:MAG: DUF4476 domain-containing protein [Bacteroidetes bacterium]|nr:DUF4476 domain-containing protein [Bacteroidota bacterium]